jgi:hypothetical protein
MENNEGKIVNNPERKTICECGWRGRADELLAGPNPFATDETVYGCPKCKAIEKFRTACDGMNDIGSTYASIPKPRLLRLIRTDEWLWGKGWCPKCGSTMIRTHLLFGKIRCIHPKCESNQGGR